jgi:hypothetical protein
MTQRISNLIIILAAFLTITGCKKVIQVDLNNAAPQLVIEGNISDGPGPYKVMVSRTVNFSADNTYPPVSGATVRITDSTLGTFEQLEESDSGIYTTQFLQGYPGHTYQLQVVADGSQYNAVSTMPRPVRLDSVFFAENIGFGNNTAISAVVNFQDPPGIKNYYQFVEMVNSRVIPDIFVFEDRLSDGKYIVQTLFNDSSYMKPKDTLLLTMRAWTRISIITFLPWLMSPGTTAFSRRLPPTPLPISAMEHSAISAPIRQMQ